MSTEILSNDEFENSNVENEENTNEPENTEQEALDSLFNVLEFRQRAIKEAQQAYEQTLRDIAQTVGKTFCYNGQYYQVCNRKSKKTGELFTYMKTLPGAPKTWLKGMPEGGWPSMQKNALSLEEIDAQVKEAGKPSERPPAQEETVQSDNQDEGTKGPEVFG